MHYLQYQVYLIASKFVAKVNWPFTSYIHECREEITEQLDIKSLVKRIIFLEYAISYVLEDYHLAEMQLKRPSLPSEIRALREKILAKEALEDERGQEESEREGAKEESGKEFMPIYEQMDSVIEQATPVELSKQQTVRGKVRVDEIRAEIISYGNSSSDHRVANECERKKSIVKKQTRNFKKLKESAMQGNHISRKLLMMAGGDSDDPSVSSELENISCTGFFNKNVVSISKICSK